MGGRGVASPDNKQPLQRMKEAPFEKNALYFPPNKSLGEAIGKRQGEISIKEATREVNSKRYSPNHAEFSQNCQRCVVAYELNRRGYKVMAEPTHKGDKWNKALVKNGNEYQMWRGAFRHAKTIKIQARNSNQAVTNIKNQMKAFGDGSRGVISVEWKQGGSGHVFNVENRKGHILFIDAQSGKEYTQRNLFENAKVSQIRLTRTDNLRISERCKEFVRVRK